MNTAPLHFSKHARKRVCQRQISQEALRAATLFGDRFVQEDGTIVQIVTRRAAERIVALLGLRPGYVHETMRNVYVVVKRSGAIVTAGRRYAGQHIRCS